jgi:hypothetical protein
MVLKYRYQDLPLQDPTKFSQIGIFGLKTNHLATLLDFINYSLTNFPTIAAIMSTLPPLRFGSKKRINQVFVVTRLTTTRRSDVSF